jgi:hypothetical protein
MFVVKAHAAEAFEQRRFERLALADCHAHLGKRRMKALIPEVITAVYAATSIILFGVGTWVISQGSFNGAGMVSFVTSLVLLIEPIQVERLSWPWVCNSILYTLLHTRKAFLTENIVFISQWFWLDVLSRQWEKHTTS